MHQYILRLYKLNIEQEQYTYTYIVICSEASVRGGGGVMNKQK